MTNSEPVSREQLIELADLILERDDAIRDGDTRRARMLHNLIGSVLQRFHDSGTSLADLHKILDERRAERDAQREEIKAEVARTRLAEEEVLALEKRRRAEEEKLRAEAARKAEEEKLRAEAARMAEEEKQRAEAAKGVDLSVIA